MIPRSPLPVCVLCVLLCGAGAVAAARAEAPDCRPTASGVALLDLSGADVLGAEGALKAAVRAEAAERAVVSARMSVETAHQMAQAWRDEAVRKATTAAAQKTTPETTALLDEVRNAAEQAEDYATLAEHYARLAKHYVGEGRSVLEKFENELRIFSGCADSGEDVAEFLEKVKDVVEKTSGMEAEAGELAQRAKAAATEARSATNDLDALLGQRPGGAGGTRAAKEAAGQRFWKKRGRSPLADSGAPAAPALASLLASLLLFFARAAAVVVAL